MTPALDVEECAACLMVNHCDAWSRAGAWAHKKGVRPCRPVVQYQPHVRPIITEVPMSDPARMLRLKATQNIIDADRNQEIAIQNRFSLRRNR
jgi:hypothetical protein